MNELKPCPFCGGEALVVSVPISGVWCVQCKNCTAMIGRKNKAISSLIGKEYFEDREAAEIAWNKRYDYGKAD